MIKILGSSGWKNSDSTRDLNLSPLAVLSRIITWGGRIKDVNSLHTKLFGLKLVREFTLLTSISSGNFTMGKSLYANFGYVCVVGNLLVEYISVVI